MPYYRLYFIDDRGHFRNAAEFECESDDEAIQRAKSHHDGGRRELWNLQRLVWSHVPGPDEPQ